MPAIYRCVLYVSLHSTRAPNITLLYIYTLYTGMVLEEPLVSLSKGFSGPTYTFPFLQIVLYLAHYLLVFLAVVMPC